MTQPTPNSPSSDWHVFRGTRKPDGDISRLPDPPPWREFGDDDESAARRQRQRGETFLARPEVIEMVNAALYLRRPLLITGKPGIGKSSLAYAVAHELQLGDVLKWAITTSTRLKDGLYSYDAIARLQDAQSSGKDNREEIGEYITLGALGTAFITPEGSANKPRVLLIDEIDKSDIDLPNDLLNLFEDGEFPIPELQRNKQSLVTVRTADRKGQEQGTTVVKNGIVRCQVFPLVIMTSNDERDFPPPFLRRCLRLDMTSPTKEELSLIVEKHLKPEAAAQAVELIGEFFTRSQKGMLATDQLLNAVYMLTNEKASPQGADWETLKERLLKSLSGGGT